MDKLSRRSAKSSKKGRSRSMTPPPKAGSKKSTKSRRSRKSVSKYSKLRDEDDDEIEMMDLNNLADIGALAQKDIGKGGELRPHEIYENTMYIPNKELRLLNIPLNSNLNF